VEVVALVEEVGYPPLALVEVIVLIELVVVLEKEEPFVEVG
jgi:hypothetical protein